MTGTKVWPDPQTDDPLKEPTLQRRLWAAYLRAGFTRKTFAVALGKSYQTVFNLDTGKATPELATLLRACELVEYTPDQLIYGYDAPSFAVRAVAMAPEEIAVLLHSLRMPFECSVALHELKTGPGGEYLLLTQSFVSAYAAAFVAVFQREDPSTLDRAKVHARIMATQGSALAEAVNLEALPISPTPAPASRRQRKVTRRESPAKRARK